MSIHEEASNQSGNEKDAIEHRRGMKAIGLGMSAAVLLFGVAGVAVAVTERLSTQEDSGLAGIDFSDNDEKYNRDVVEELLATPSYYHRPEDQIELYSPSDYEKLTEPEKSELVPFYVDPSPDDIAGVMEFRHACDIVAHSYEEIAIREGAVVGRSVGPDDDASGRELDNALEALPGRLEAVGQTGTAGLVRDLLLPDLSDPGSARSGGTRLPTLDAGPVGDFLALDCGEVVSGLNVSQLRTDAIPNARGRGLDIARAMVEHVQALRGG